MFLLKQGPHILLQLRKIREIVGEEIMILVAGVGSSRWQDRRVKRVVGFESTTDDCK